MRQQRNDIAAFRAEDNKGVAATLDRFFLLARENPFILKPLRRGKIPDSLSKGPAELPQLIQGFDRVPLWQRDGFFLFPTVEKTTLLFDSRTDHFIKILHPLRAKDRVLSMGINKSRQVCIVSKTLRSKGVKVPEVTVYGKLVNSRSSFYMMNRITGSSLHKALLNEKRELSFDIYRKVIEHVAEVHRLRYWFGDLRISHVFIENGTVSGFVDIDSIRKNLPYRLRNVAKDLAGLNRPELPLSRDEKMELFRHYAEWSGIRQKEELLSLVKYYTERRWGT